MATKEIVTCDRCGKAITTARSTLVTTGYAVVNPIRLPAEMDLCADCAAELADWHRKPTAKQGA